MAFIIVINVFAVRACTSANIWLMPSNCLNSHGLEIASGMQFSNNTDNLRTMTMTMEQQMETETNAFACIITGRRSHQHYHPIYVCSVHKHVYVIIVCIFRYARPFYYVLFCSVLCIYSAIIIFVDGC